MAFIGARPLSYSEGLVLPYEVVECILSFVADVETALSFALAYRPFPRAIVQHHIVRILGQSIAVQRSARSKRWDVLDLALTHGKQDVESVRRALVPALSVFAKSDDVEGVRQIEQRAHKLKADTADNQAVVDMAYFLAVHQNATRVMAYTLSRTSWICMVETLDSIKKHGLEATQHYPSILKAIRDQARSLKQASDPQDVNVEEQAQQVVVELQDRGDEGQVSGSTASKLYSGLLSNENAALERDDDGNGPQALRAKSQCCTSRSSCSSSPDASDDQSGENQSSVSSTTESLTS